MIISAETCTSWLLRVSKALLAEATKRLKTSADIVAISAIPSLTTSFESLLRCSSGSTLCTTIASSALPKTSANTIQPIAIGLMSHPPASPPGVLILPSEFESGGEDRPLHVDVEAQIEAAALCIVKVEAAVAEVQVYPWGRRIVDRADQLPIAMRADAKPADIAIAGQAEPAGQEPAGEVDMVASADQRIAPAGHSVGARAGELPRVQGQVRGKRPGAETDAQIGVLGRLLEGAVEQQRGPGIGYQLCVTAAEQIPRGGDSGTDGYVQGVAEEADGPIADLDRPHERNRAQMRQQTERADIGVDRWCTRQRRLNRRVDPGEP